MKMVLQLCSLTLQVLASGFSSSETPGARSCLWIWASWVSRRGTINVSVLETGSAG